MFDTHLVVVGNVLVAPEWRRVTTSGNLVANFRIASNARRFDRENNTWVDGNSLRIRVSAWRRLAEGVASSITVGDPVIVYGRLFTRDWKDEQGNPRVSYEMEAYSIGHDLARGRSRFFRQKSLPGSAAIEDAEADMLVAGLPSIPLTVQESPIGYGEGMPAADPPSFAEPPAFPELPSELSPVAEAPSPVALVPDPEPSSLAEAPQEPSPVAAVPDPEPEEEAAPEEAASPADDFSLEVERLTAAQPTTPTRRGRRSAKREPIAA
ncbi:single-stranded DNA-binding protein [Paractinoplanes atraurantiacus]|uniref:Single-stranded DNA-binding protein n=1 Tax=Paractinoplanes atraurantiacus TaxID=1036182 RepID=A0A285H807_9ACTN|nr:single-strand DNA-binding protein [Actinoplanes atraurantiacus]